MSTDAFPDERALVAALRAGDNQAFEVLFMRYAPRLLRVARSLLGSDEDARDAVQDAMIAVHRSIASFESQAALSTWLHRIVVNTSLMKLRTKRRRGETVDIEELLPRFEEDGHQSEPAVPWTESPEVMLERDETRAMIRAAIEKLPENHRIVLLLRDIEELSTEETASILGVSKGAVKIRLHRARQALRTLIDREAK